MYNVMHFSELSKDLAQINSRFGYDYIELQLVRFLICLLFLINTCISQIILHVLIHLLCIYKMHNIIHKSLLSLCQFLVFPFFLFTSYLITVL